VRALRDAACTYASWGWSVHPLKPRSKQPLTPNGLLDATSDLASVLAFWQRWPTANIGINCRASGLLVIDVDPRNGGDDSFWDLQVPLGLLPECPSATTGGGGMHYFFKHPDCDVVGKLAEGVDLKSRGYVLAAPSTHPSGQPYEWEIHPREVPLRELEGEWLRRATSPVPMRTDTLVRNPDHDDDLRRIPAATYLYRLTGREVNRMGFAQCPFHGGGGERTPSLKVSGELWACHACEPLWGKRAMGGNVYDLAGLLWDYPLPLRGADFAEVSTRLREELL
jgi:hypothetical protein